MISSTSPGIIPNVEAIVSEFCPREASVNNAVTAFGHIRFRTRLSETAVVNNFFL